MTTPAPAPAQRATIRQVLAVKEFRALLLSSAASLAGDQVAKIAIALLVYSRTGSTFLASATYAASFLSYFLSGPPLSTVADRVRRRRLMVACDLARAALVALLLIPGVPLALLFVVLIAVGVLSPPFGAARASLVPEVLPGDLYVVGSGVQNALAQGANVGGFLLGGVVVALASVRGAIAIDAVTFVLSAVLLVQVAERPHAPRPPSSYLADTREGILIVARSRRLRRMLGYGWLAAVTMILPEGLAVPISSELGGGAVAAGVLTAAVPSGYLVGSVLILRIPPERRERLLPLLALIAAGPLLLTPLTHSLAWVFAVWAISGIGGALSLVANAGFMLGVTPAIRGRAFGVAVTTLMAVEGSSLLATGAVAELVAARAVVAVAAIAPLSCVIAEVLQHRLSANSASSRHAGRSTVTPSPGFPAQESAAANR